MYPAAHLAAVVTLGAWLVHGHSDAMATTSADAEAGEATTEAATDPVAEIASIAPPDPLPEVVETTPAEHLAEALAAARTGDWAAAMAAGQEGGEIPAAIVLWLRLRDGAGEWTEYRAFLDAHPDWPNQDVLRRAAERRIPMSLPPREVFAFFGARQPQTGVGALRLAAALTASGRRSAAEAAIIRAWREMSLSSAEQQAFRERWGTVIRPYHTARLDNLLWRGWTTEAEAMLPLVDDGWKLLARARIMTRRDAEGLAAAISAVPAGLRGDPGLAYERYRYRVEKGRWDEAEAYLLEKSTSHAALGRPDMWMERRANLARQALRRGDVQDAYALAANSFGESGAAYADAEWLAGFIALTRLDDAGKAIAHFERFQAVVATPISLGRAGYWLGRAHTRLGNAEAATAAYAAAAAHQTSFYGQLAAEAAGRGADALLAGGTTSDWREQPFLASPVVQAARLLAEAGDEARSMQFLRHVAADMEPDARAALAQMAIDTGRPHVGVRIAKDAAAAGVILPDQYYPLHAIAGQEWPVPPEFALAIARQESELNPAAISSAGARGLMQLMPATAEQMAGVVGTDYDLARLTTDPTYNATLGTTYLSRMLSRYRGSYILAAAAYNAGPGRADDWIRTYGDPRDPETDAIAWIEMIPFTETRNYVMRVLEGLHVYRARLTGEAAALRIMADINGAG